MICNDIVFFCVLVDLFFVMFCFCIEYVVVNVMNVLFFCEFVFIECFGVNLNEGVLCGFVVRVVIVVDEFGVIIYSELVNEIINELDYDCILMLL